MIRSIRMVLGRFLHAMAGFVLPSHWVCTNCGNVEWREREVRCWGCGIGEMIYQG